MMSPEEYLAQHKKAFRIAFDFLTAHFPPETEPEWWESAAKDLSDSSARGEFDSLTDGLLIAVYEYLFEEYKKRRDNHGKTDD